MGTHVLFDANEDRAILYDSVTEIAFGRTFKPCDGENAAFEADEVATMFLKWYAENGPTNDPRTCDNIVDLQDEFMGNIIPSIDAEDAEGYEP